ncbi:hypothetical protein E3N88_25281 [Mikania micrantha]|uniref:Uncharacterized protein n=1 Tax=Mikania micrantha TaxID=192012 RepID=A0A5N6N5N5_9ASTR|nr:hypothetical protein E3N88_25281 [Mikania micrantha]
MNTRRYGSVSAAVIVVVIFIFQPEFLQLQTNFNLHHHHHHPADHNIASSNQFHPTLTRRPRRLPELELARARVAIRRAAVRRNLSQLLRNGDVLSTDIYHNPTQFYQ